MAMQQQRACDKRKSVITSHDNRLPCAVPFLSKDSQLYTVEAKLCSVCWIGYQLANIHFHISTFSILVHLLIGEAKTPYQRVLDSQVFSSECCKNLSGCSARCSQHFCICTTLVLRILLPKTYLRIITTHRKNKSKATGNMLALQLYRVMIWLSPAHNTEHAHYYWTCNTLNGLSPSTKVIPDPNHRARL